MTTKPSVITILGATGSIGENTLDVVRRHPERYRVYALTAHRQVDKLALQCVEFQPEVAVVGSASAAQELNTLLKQKQIKTEVVWGEDALIQVAQANSVNMVMAAIVGAAGLPPTIAAAKAGKRVLLANKEALVMSGALFMDEIKRSGAELLPIDSEHNAIFQCLPTRQEKMQSGVEEILLTASGGPFLHREIHSLQEVTPDEACAHPNWVMGRKISVDSATMMNKGLEVIEAHWLFNAPADNIQVLIHPQSIIHSMVRYADGSVLAQLGNPDMRTPIAYGMAWPERMEAGVKHLNFSEMAQLSFSAPDLQRFPALSLAYAALREGGTAPCILNAANEIAVDAFLQKKIRFTEIASIVSQVLNQLPSLIPKTLDDIFETDTKARSLTQALIH